MKQAETERTPRPPDGIAAGNANIGKSPAPAAAPNTFGLAGSTTVGYLSMEIGLENNLPTFSGGLGVLAGDTLRSAADLGIRMIGVTLLYRKGYFRQSLDDAGNQAETAASWRPEMHLDEMEPRVSVQIEGRSVMLRAWRYLVRGIGGHAIPVYLLDSDVEPNAPLDREFTHSLYGGDDRYRLCQETILGIGGLQMLQALGHSDLDAYHMNEGHAALLALHLLEHRAVAKIGAADRSDVDAVRRRCVFTTHTPVPAGHDSFSKPLVESVLGSARTTILADLGLLEEQKLNMTHLALECAGYVNGVARIHQGVSQAMFPRYRIRAVTNGVHAGTWTCPSMRRLFDRHIPEWRFDNAYLRYAVDIPTAELVEAHREAKAGLIAAVRDKTGVQLDDSVFTIGFARRATPYKRADLLFHSLDRLRWIARNLGPFQLVYGGKSHPRDEGGKDLIRRVFAASKELGGAVRAVYVEDYDMQWGQLLTSGVDLWLNTPEKTREASGTSGMKAALNGVPSLSVLDGWWIEGHVEGVTGWSVANRRNAPDDEGTVAHSLYGKLERLVIPLFYERPNDYATVMRSTIALNGSFFNTHRMVSQYLFNAYSQRARVVGETRPAER